MTAPLFLAEQVPVTIGAVATITGAEAHHAAAVRRLRLGEHVYVADGQGHAIFGQVESVAKTEITVSVEQTLTEPTAPHHWVAIQALPKGERADIAVETLTELGVDEIVAWQASRSVSRWENKIDKGVARWQAIAREAAKQSRRFTVPMVSYANSSQVVKRIEQAQLAVICHEAADRWVETSELPQTGEVVFIMGPEGGITDQELGAFESAGGVIMKIADHVLRTSTAGTVALATLQSFARGKNRG